MIKILPCLIIFALLFSCNNLAKNNDDSSSVDEVIRVSGEIVEDTVADAFQNILPDEPDMEDAVLEYFNPIGVIGKGVVMIDPYSENEEDSEHKFLSIYDDAACRNLYTRYNFVDSYKLPKGKNLSPLYFKVDYGYYCFICTAETKDSYEIAINKTERKYLKKEKKTTFYIWERFFERILGIESSEDNPFRTAPDDNAPVINSEKYDNIDNFIDIYSERKVEIHGEWMKMTFPKADNEVYWIKWRKGNDIIIRTYISI